MMKKTNKKRGFTIIELTIVVAVIAILSAVLIPTFAAIIKKSRESADQQAVRSMNTALAAETITDDLNIFDVFEVLEDNGMDGQNYKSLAKDKAFFYDAELKRILYVDTATDTAVYPEEYAGRTNNGKWTSLSGEIETVKPDDYTSSATTVAVESGKQLAYVIDQINDNKSDATTIELAGTIDMMGAELNLEPLNKNETLTIKGSETDPVVIKNATAVEGKTTYKKLTPGQNNTYNLALFTRVYAGAKVTLENVVIENVNMKETHVGNCAFLVGILDGTLELNNVTIKNSSIIGGSSVGALVGNMTKTGKIVANDVTIENVDLKCVVGRVGKLIGNMSTAATPTTNTAEITMTNCTTGIYFCEQNTGSGLGLIDGNLWGWRYEADGNVEEAKARAYFENTLAGNLASNSTETSYTTLAALVA